MGAFEDELLRLIARRRPGYRALCATVDLLGVKAMLEVDSVAAMNRLNDLLEAIAHATQFFPGDGQERACFAGDSWFFVREVRPEEHEVALWKEFCGRLFALVSIAAEIEVDLGNPGLRVIASRGDLAQTVEPDSWREDFIEDQTRHWFVLTGAAEGLRKSQAAEAAGAAGGFTPSQFWHEELGKEFEYLGTPLSRIRLESYGDRQAYVAIFEEMCARATGVAVLDRKAMSRR